MALYTRTIFNPSQTTWLILAPMTIDYSKFFTIPVLLQKKMKKPSQCIYIFYSLYGTFFLKLSCHKSLYSSHQKIREENTTKMFIFVYNLTYKKYFWYSKKNISFDYSSHLSTSLCIKRQLDRYSVFFSSCYLFCICRIYCCK